MRFFLILGGVGAVIAAAFVLFLVFTVNIPDLNDADERRIAQSTKIYDRTGQILLYDVHGTEKRTVIPFSEIPRHVKNATIALEDDSFYQHHGIRPLSTLRAVLRNIFTGSSQGGSTITQQLAKNIFLTPEKTVTRKLKEWILALKIEREYAKDEILSLYLNQIPYGNGAYGIEAAAETFFGKKARDLGLRESAYLAVLPRATTFYSPYGKNRKALDDRAAFALRRMKELDLISEQEYEAATRSEIVFSPARTQGIIAPHFVIEVREKLNRQFGEDIVERGGLRVVTTLDVDLQKKAEEVVEKYAESIEKNFDARNSGMVAIDPKTGDVLAMVGSRNYFDIEHEGNFNITTAHRQPGSAFKPFVYATALKKGFTPETAIFDVPTEFNPLCTPDGIAPPGAKEDICYHPQNYDEKFRGPVTIREALAQSLNVPAVKVLYLAGLGESLATARDFGITSLNEPDRYGLTLVLGGGEVSVLELTSAFGVFANNGTKNPSRDILSIEDVAGRSVFRSELHPTEVIDPNIARAITDILSDNKARTPAFGEFSALYFPGKKVAAKTGTTNDYRDAWVLGYTPGIAIGAWSGNNDNTPMQKKVAGFIVAPWWHEIMEYALVRMPSEEFQTPDRFPQPKPVLRGEWRGGVEYVIDRISGKLATEFTPKETQEKRVVMQVHSILYWIDKDDPFGPEPNNPEKDSQFTNWESKVREWALSNKFFDQTTAVIPKESDTVHTPLTQPKITGAVISPQKEEYLKSETIVIRPIFESTYPIVQIDYFINEEFAGSVKRSPFEFTTRLDAIPDTLRNIPIKIRAYDGVGNTVEKTIFISLASA